MESFVNAAMLIEVTLLSFLMALWMTWLGLSCLFRMVPSASRDAAPIKFVANQRVGSRSRHAA